MHLDEHHFLATHIPCPLIRTHVRLTYHPSSQTHLRQLEALRSQLGQARGEAQQLGGQLAAERAGRVSDVEALRRQLREAGAEEARAVAELHDACECFVVSSRKL